MFNFLKNIFSRKKVEEKPVSEAAKPQEESKPQQEVPKTEAKPEAQKEV